MLSTKVNNPPGENLIPACRLPVARRRRQRRVLLGGVRLGGYVHLNLLSRQASNRQFRHHVSKQTRCWISVAKELLQDSSVNEED